MSARAAGLLLWLVLGGLAAAALFWQQRHPPRPPTVANAGAAVRVPELPVVTPLEPFQLPPPDQYAETVARPLFIATRRPEPPPPADEVPPPEPLLTGPEQKFLLLGVMITPQMTIALLRPEEPNAKIVRLKPGETVGEWRLEMVSPNQVVLRKGAITQELVLARPKKPTGPRRTGARPAPTSSASGTGGVPQTNPVPASVVPPPPQP
ncbi:MAG: hypothetical protein IPL99_01620 [Candidatus Competibacteraceae bacterium]|nr:hypothetical protein [Candidatus Competibacteraceae bacterium]